MMFNLGWHWHWNPWSNQKRCASFFVHRFGAKAGLTSMKAHAPCLFSSSFFFSHCRWMLALVCSELLTRMWCHPLALEVLRLQVQWSFLIVIFLVTKDSFSSFFYSQSEAERALESKKRAKRGEVCVSLFVVIYLLFLLLCDCCFS